jgi:WD40 repeat protein
MDFTSLYSHAGQNATIASPDNALLATSTLTLLVLRDAETFQVLQSWRIPSGCTFSHLAFSQDSRYLAAACTNDKQPLVHVYSVTLGEKPAAVITPGSEGLQGIKWWDDNSFGKRWLACWSRHNVRFDRYWVFSCQPECRHNG